MADRINSADTHRGDEIDLIAIWNLIWLNRLQIALITGLFVFGSIVYSLTLDNIYRSEVVLVPAEVRQPSSALLGQLGAAASLVGINAGSADTTKTATAIATLQSRSFIRDFISRHDILPALMASNWDNEERRNVIDSDIYDEASLLWVGEKPTDLDAFKVFGRILGVSESQNNGLITISVDWTDPLQAKEWAGWVVADINRQIKERDQQEAEDAIGYLQEQLQATQLVEMQRAFYQLIESQTRIVMLADVREDYVFRIIDPAFVPEERSSPNRTFICIVGSFLGLFLSLFIVFVRNAILQANNQQKNN